MASNIPRFLLPQHGSMWRSTIPAARTASFVKPLDTGIGQSRAHYASKTTSGKVSAPKSGAAQGAGASSAAAKAAKASAPSKPPPKKAAGTKTAAVKTPLGTTRKTTFVAEPTATNSAAVAAAGAAEKPPVDKKPASTRSSVANPSAAVSAATKKSSTSAESAKDTASADAAANVATAAAAAAPTSPDKPIVLEKPERFNPPSHGKRLPRSIPKHYGGPTTQTEIKAQSTRQYPGLPPPENTWSHWFINNRNIHLVITLGTLSSLAIYTFSANFQEKSPFAHMVPPISELPLHPISYVRTCFEVLKLHEEHESALVAEKRRRKVDDVAKRNEYRKAHGMEPAHGFTPWGSPATTQEADGAEDPSQSPQAAPSPVPATDAPTAAAEFTADGKRKKFLGIF